jgi:prepilin-type N-terminal cleavage/methylation domain-containing protein
MVRNVHNFFHASPSGVVVSCPDLPLVPVKLLRGRTRVVSEIALVVGTEGHGHCSSIITVMCGSSGKLSLRKIGVSQGFTLIELLVAAALLALLAGSSIWALTQANNYASIARLYTGAESAAQNQIDLILTESPFNPQANPPEIPSVLTVGTSAPQTVTLYSDPNGSYAVTGQLVTTVTANNVVTQGQNLNLYSATVVVTYTYRSKVYQVQLNAMRASDV